MFPCIKPQDTLHIESKNAEEIKIGDIAVYRRLNRLFAHRTIAKGTDNNLDYIITRPDISRYGNDGPIFAGDILGIVSCIERKGKLLGTEKKNCSLFIRPFLNMALKCYNFGQYFWGKIVYALTYLQQLKAYRIIAKFLFSNPNDKLNFSIHIPLNPKITNRFYRIISPEEFIKFNLAENTDSTSRWMLKMEVNSRPAAFLSFSGRRISEIKIRVRYRRTAIEERLFQKLDELLSCAGIPELFTGVPEDAHLARMVFKNLGFKETKNINDKSVTQVIMQRKIKGAD